MNRFKCLLLPMICLVWLANATFSFAQNRQPNRDERSRDDRNREERNRDERSNDYDPYADRYRNRSRCTEALPMRSFNRDFASLSVTSPFFMVREFRSYARQRCLSSEQVRRLAVLIPSDREKYDFLKYALDFVIDFENYASTGSAMANIQSRDVYYRYLVRQGVPVGNYFDDSRFRRDNNNCCNTCPPSNPDRRNRDPRDDYSADRDWDRNSLDDNDRRRETPNNNPNNPRALPQLNEREFDRIKNQIRESGVLDKNRLDLAKSLTQENGLSSNQMVEVAKLFTYDANRLDYLKFSFDFVTDRQNFGSVTQAFAFDVNKRDFERFLADKN